jgi:hypothetical protein
MNSLILNNSTCGYGKYRPLPTHEEVHDSEATNSSDDVEEANIDYSLTDADFVDASKVKPTRLPLVLAKIVGMLKDFRFTIGTLISRRKNSVNYGKVIGDPAQAKAIVVLMHGLKAHPSQMDGHAEAFRKRLGKDVLIYQVQVDKLGNCSKAEAIKRITDTVLPILQQNPAMKLYAHGISNGGRLAAQLAINILAGGVEGKRVMVNANSAPLYGTKVMMDPDTAFWRQKIWTWFLKSSLPMVGNHCEEIIKDFTWASEPGKEMVKGIRSAAKIGVRFQFDGSVADSKVTPPSFFPSGVQAAEYFCPERIQGHSSIIDSQRERQVEDAVNFILAGTSAL